MTRRDKTVGRTRRSGLRRRIRILQNYLLEPTGSPASLLFGSLSARLKGEKLRASNHLNVYPLENEFDLAPTAGVAHAESEAGQEQRQHENTERACPSCVETH